MVVTGNANVKGKSGAMGIAEVEIIVEQAALTKTRNHTLKGESHEKFQ